MSASPNLLNITNRICYMEGTISQLVSRVESLEHLANQQSILVDTLGSIMEELKKQEH